MCICIKILLKIGGIVLLAAAAAALAYQCILSKEKYPMTERFGW